MPRVTVIGFYFLLVFVGATIPAGIYGAIVNLCSPIFVFTPQQLIICINYFCFSIVQQLYMQLNLNMGQVFQMWIVSTLELSEPFISLMWIGLELHFYVNSLNP